MKICQINCIYGIGSTGKLTRDLHLSLLDNGFQSIVISPNSNQFTTDKGVFTLVPRWVSLCSAVLKRGLGMQYDWAYYQTHKIIGILKREKPDVVHLQCINGNNINVYQLYHYLAKNKIKTLLTLHAEFPYTGGCGHAYECNRWKIGCGKCPIRKEATQSVIFDLTARTWKKLSSSYRDFRPENFHITAVSPWLLSRAEESPLLHGFKKNVVLNSVDVEIFKYYPFAKNEWNKKLGIKDEKILLYVTAGFYPHLQDLKGGRFIVDLAERLKDKNIRVVIAANYGDPGTLPSNIVYLGRVGSQNELAQLYSSVDLSVITSRRETFSMPVAESLCCGTPIVGFKAGGPESIAIKQYSEFVEYGDLNALYECIVRWMNSSHDKFTISEQSILLYSKSSMAQEFIKQYLSL